MGRSLQLRLPWPPSVNGYWRTFRGRQIISKKGRSYRENAIAEVVSQIGGMPVPSDERMAVSLLLYPPDRRQRDVDNYSKAVLDALTHCGIWEDDSQIDELHVYRRGIESPGFVVVEIRKEQGQ